MASPHTSKDNIENSKYIRSKTIETLIAMDRKVVLLNLLKFESPLDRIQAELSQFPWDSEKEYVRVNNEVLICALNKFLAKEVSADQLEEWANIIECREDIGFDNEYLMQVIFELANPILYGSITETSVRDIISSLSE